MKECRKCKRDLPDNCFRPDLRYLDGLGSWCVECHRKRNSEWAKENRKRLTAKSAQWREENAEKARESDRRWKSANPEKIAECYRNWRKNNLAHDCHRVAIRRAAKVRAIPLWADESETQRFYAMRPAGMQVDHIIPLISPVVCGLHWIGNLQYLPPKENQSKGNRLLPDVPRIAAAYAQGRLFA